MERDLFLLELDSIGQMPEKLHLPSKYFVALTLMDSHALTGDELMRFAAKLVDNGAAYVSAWGPDCTRIDDCVDDEVVIRRLNNIETIPLLMTTWHASDSLEKFLWFGLTCTSLDEQFVPDCRCCLAFVVGKTDWANSVRSAFNEPRVFCERVLDNESSAAGSVLKTCNRKLTTSLPLPLTSPAASPVLARLSGGTAYCRPKARAPGPH